MPAQIVNQESACRLYLEDLEGKRENPEYRALPLPFSKLEDALGELRLEEMTIVGGYEGHGKSVLANQIAFFLGNEFRQDKEPKRQVLIATVEMGFKQVINRYLTSLVDIPVSRLVTPDKLNPQELEKVKTSATEVADYRMCYLDSQFISIKDIEENLSLLREEGPVRLLVVDYLQLLRDCSDGSRQATDAAAFALKELAIRYQMHVICISNLNRATDSPGYLKEPTTLNLRNSQGIANSADNVLFVFRPEVIDPEDCLGYPMLRGGALLSVPKQRNGKTGKYTLDWNGKKMIFSNPTDKRLQPVRRVSNPEYSFS